MEKALRESDRSVHESVRDLRRIRFATFTRLNFLFFLHPHQITFKNDEHQQCRNEFDADFSGRCLVRCHSERI